MRSQPHKERHTMNPAGLVLETERLWFRRLTPDDLDPLAELYADPEVMRYIGQGQPRSRTETQEKLAALIDAEADEGFGMWATLDKATGAFVGRCGLAVWEVEGRREAEIVYLLGRAYWGRGLATEAACAIRDYGFNVLSRQRLISLIYHANTASSRVAMKAGLRYERDVSFMGQVVALYSIQRERAKP